jgi:hypothetical protein
MTTAGFHRFDRPAARGMTLLEVLISCGVLVVGLASIASLLPAAGSRLGQAATEDRGGTLAANARTDAVARGLVAFDLFADASKSLCFGKGMMTDTTLNAGLAAARFAAPVAATLNQRIDPLRGFVLEDEVVFTPPTTTETPLNDFLDGRRVFKEGICWGATLVPQAFPAKAGSPAVLGVAVFRKDPTPRAISLTLVSGGLYRMTTPDVTPLPASPTPAQIQQYERNMAPYEADMKRLLKSCSSVLVPGTDSAKGPRWFRITASWRPALNPETNQRQNDGCYVVFSEFKLLDEHAGANPTVIGFDNLIRVDQYNVVLQ